MAKQIYVGPRHRWRDNPRFVVSVLVLVALCVGVAIAIGTAVTSCTASEESGQGTHASVATDVGVADKAADITSGVRVALVPGLVDTASGVASINLFAASGEGPMSLDEGIAAPIEDALAAFSEQGYEAGFIVIDLTTGKGLGYNADEMFFSASTIKAPYVGYVYQSVVGNDEAVLREYLDKDIIVEGTGIMIDDDEEGYELSEVLADTIVHSDNTGYALLRERYDGPGWNAWVDDVGIEVDGIDSEWYPYYSARDLAKFWIAIASYLESDPPVSTLFETLLASTETSFIRQALGVDAVVYAKAGYEIDTETYDMGSLNDAGIVSGPSGTYLISVMSDVDYDDGWLTDNEWLIVDLIQALDRAHAAVLAA